MNDKKFMNDKKILDTIFKQLTELGSAVITAIFALFLLYFNQNIAIKIISGIIGVTIISYIIKAVFFKSRPKKQSTTTIVEKIDAASFPSVHSARITVIIFWLMTYFFNWYIITLSTIIWILVIYSRVYLKKHYWIDVIGGIIISLIINIIIYFLFRGL
jgi:membrane-associated phospholipid phosphatase